MGMCCRLCRHALLGHLRCLQLYNTPFFPSRLISMSISNIQPRSPRLWVHFWCVQEGAGEVCVNAGSDLRAISSILPPSSPSFIYLFIAYASWLILEHYKEYIALRQTYMVGWGPSPCIASGQGCPWHMQFASAHTPVLPTVARSPGQVHGAGSRRQHPWHALATGAHARRRQPAAAQQGRRGGIQLE